MVKVFRSLVGKINFFAVLKEVCKRQKFFFRFYLLFFTFDFKFSHYFPTKYMISHYSMKKIAFGVIWLGFPFSILFTPSPLLKKFLTGTIFLSFYKMDALTFPCFQTVRIHLFPGFLQLPLFRN